MNFFFHFSYECGSFYVQLLPKIKSKVSDCQIDLGDMGQIYIKKALLIFMPAPFNF